MEKKCIKQVCQKTWNLRNFEKKNMEVDQKSLKKPEF